ncbi:MAG: tRNA pseudouridine38-40 synthase [Alteromonas naphthalenivorans]|jgi:tRNA pseudouridine38-40 synthase
MNSYKLVIAYDGTDYHGWQWQDNAVTVDSILRKTFLRTFKQTEMHIVGASRTDAGVHAQGQVVRIGTHMDIDPQKLMYVFNNALSDDIIITECSRIDLESRFHPQHDIAKKIYTYRFYLKRPGPMKQRYGCFIGYPIDTYKLVQALTVFVGTHDFRAFSKELEAKNTVRTIDGITVTSCKTTGAHIITVIGKSFLRHMIRRIVGAAFEIARKPNRSCQELKQLLLIPQLVKNLPTAPAKGLCLESITYQ